MFSVKFNEISYDERAKIKSFVEDALKWSIDTEVGIPDNEDAIKTMLVNYDRYLGNHNKPMFGMDLRTKRTKIACNLAEMKAKEWKANSFVCCICHRKTYGYGNNPYPLCDEKDYESRCCDECDNTYVIPARIARIYGGK